MISFNKGWQELGNSVSINFADIAIYSREWRFNVLELLAKVVYFEYPAKSPTELFVIIAVSRAQP